MEEFEILQEKLKGNFYSRFSVGDSWGLYFDGFWLLAHDVTSSYEKNLNEYLIKNYKPTIEAIDKEDIAKSIIVSSCLRKNILSVSLGSDSSLTLGFENDIKITLPTNTDIVDWQWAINKNGGDPYQSFIVGCFNAGEVEVENC